MSGWPATKARRVLAALQRIGWRVVRTSGSHRTLRREGWPQYRFAYHDKEELGPVILAEIAKHTGLRPENLQLRSTAPLGAFFHPSRAHDPQWRNPGMS